MKSEVTETLLDRLPQQLFIMAISDDRENFLHTCSMFDIQPVQLFTSSVTGKEKEYATFVTKDPITDIRICYAVHGCLQRLFDSNYKNIPSFKKGLQEEFRAFKSLNEATDKHILLDKPNMTVDVPYLLDVVCFKVNQDSTGGNGSKDVRDFLRAVNLQFDGKGCYLRVGSRPYNAREIITNSCDSLLYIIDTGYNFVKIHFAINSNDFIRMLNGEKLDSPGVVDFKEKKKPRRDESDDIHSLIANDNGCGMLRNVYNGSQKLKMHELIGLAQAICYLSGAQKTFSKWMKDSGKYNDLQIKLIDYLIIRYKRMGYAEYPTSCQYSCSSYNECNIGRDYTVIRITDLLKQKENTIRPLKGKKSNNRDKDDIRGEIQRAFDSDLASKNAEIYVYKCFVGLGKTRMYLAKLEEFIEQEKTVLIALPSHKLKDDVVKRLREEHLCPELINEKIIIVPEIPDIGKEFNEELTGYYAVGDHKGAKKVIENYMRDVLRKKDANDITNVERQLKNYLDITSRLRQKEFITGKIIFTTHERLFYLGHIKPDIVIIDEDITQSIIKQQSIEEDELHALRLIEQNMQKGAPRSAGIRSVIDRISHIIRAERDKLYSYNSFQGQNKIQKAILEVVSEHRKTLFNSKVVDLLFNSCEFVKTIPYSKEDDYKETINFVVKRSLPFSCKIFVMSATADFEVYQRLFGAENIKPRPFDIPKLDASITMRHDYSFSRDWFERNVENLNKYTGYLRFIKDFRLSKDKERANRLENYQPLIITFKKYEEEFRKRGFNLTLHYGNITGIDEFKGKNIAVFGTPNVHPSFYALYVNAIYPEERLESVPDFAKQLVSNDDYRFYFSTAKGSQKFRKIHMWMVESDIIQALGRARPIDNPCLIRIYSNYPPPGIDLTFLNNG